MAGAYIHIPFCKSRCIYCDFYSTTGLETHQDRYIDAILKELGMRRDYLHDHDISTLYVGGGTPSVLSPRNILRLFGGLGFHPMEVTMECNPDDVTDELATTLANVGVNRVSMGVQTFSDSRLSFLHRRHKSAQVPIAVEKLRHAGINNISIDLMFGFPDESQQQWRDDIRQALSLNVSHISAYSLMYEEGTVLYDWLTHGKIKEADDELCSAMYDVLIDSLTGAGYEHYEISNFAKPGFRSVHNSNYWNGTEYIGLGAAAHSYNRDNRQWNVSNVNEYIRQIENGVIPSESESIDPDTRYNDTVTTALRTCEGIDLSSLSDKYRRYLISNARRGIVNGLLRHENGRIALTRKGLYVNNDVMSDLIWV